MKEKFSKQKENSHNSERKLLSKKRNADCEKIKNNSD